MYTTNAIEATNAQLRNGIKRRGSLPNLETMWKGICLGIMTAAGDWTRRVKDWAVALNQLSHVRPIRLLERFSWPPIDRSQETPCKRRPGTARPRALSEGAMNFEPYN